MACVLSVRNNLTDVGGAFAPPHPHNTLVIFYHIPMHKMLFDFYPKDKNRGTW